jgi:hypothetical protein
MKAIMIVWKKKILEKFYSQRQEPMRKKTYTLILSFKYALVL